ncbi:hypothetical protein LOK49_LG01G02435 [Camellia lanceoleosa]|uniref:Uncharacterized protein n=1 Tax=Camellia lanceoleosa TaxID=1840588 RepID=A0ACC0IUI6_9ERIC|nr:hypothetical protein LOK49_LG01G02435 [Camellia lanceoleosa]
MEVKLAQSLQFSTWIDLEKMVMKPSGSLQFSRRSREQKRFQILISSHLQPTRTATATATATSHKRVALKVSCSYKNLQGSVLQSGSFPPSFDEALILKNKAEEIEPYLNGRCIYLVGMMGSGKTTIGRVLSDVLGYSFLTGLRRYYEIDYDAGASCFHRWRCSYSAHQLETHAKGISVWLDVPLEALARRIAAVGTGSRPLLHQEAGDAYSKAFTRLSTLMEERSEAYANANARVSLENIASKLGYIDVCNLTPTVIAIEVSLSLSLSLSKCISGNTL